MKSNKIQKILKAFLLIEHRRNQENSSWFKHLTLKTLSSPLWPAERDSSCQLTVHVIILVSPELADTFRAKKVSDDEGKDMIKKKI